MARARRRKSNQSNNLTYYIIGAAVLILIIFAFPTVGKFTANLYDSSSGVEIELITPDWEILQPGGTGVINFTFRYVQDFDTLSFKTNLPNGSLADNGTGFKGFPLQSSNTNVVIGSTSDWRFAPWHHSRITTLNFQGINGTNIAEQNLTLSFTANHSTNLSEIVISDILFGDSDGDAIASFSNISLHEAVPANLPPTVRIHSPSSGSSWPHNQEVIFNLSISDPDGSTTSFGYWMDGSPYTPPWGSFGFWRRNMTIGNHTFVANATDDDGESTKVSRSFEVYNATVPTSAVVAVISSPSSQQTYYLGEDIFFNGSSSYSINSSIVFYQWRVGYSGTLCDTNDRSIFNTSTHTLSASSLRQGARNYTALLDIRDNNGAAAYTCNTFIITSLGDVNGDGQITGADVTASEWLSVGVNRNYATQNADTNQDSSTNSLDITGVERILLD